MLRVTTKNKLSNNTKIVKHKKKNSRTKQKHYKVIRKKKKTKKRKKATEMIKSNKNVWNYSDGVEVLQLYIAKLLMSMSKDKGGMVES